MTSSNDEARRDPQEERPDLTQELWPDATAEQRSATDTTQQLPTGDAEDTVATTDTGPQTETSGPTTTATTTAATTTTAAWPPATPPRPTGPHLPAILLGLVCLVVAGVVLAQELGNLSIDWGNVGPLGFVAVGAVLVVLGVIGLAGSNRRNARS